MTTLSGNNEIESSVIDIVQSTEFQTGDFDDLAVENKLQVNGNIVLANDTATLGDVIKYTASGPRWEPDSGLSSASIASLDDTVIVSAQNNNILTYNGAAWVNSSEVKSDNIDSSGTTLDIGKTNATTVNVAKAGVQTNVLGDFSCNEAVKVQFVDTPASPDTLKLGHTLANAVEVGRSGQETRIKGDLIAEQGTHALTLDVGGVIGTPAYTLPPNAPDEGEVLKNLGGNVQWVADLVNPLLADGSQALTNNWDAGGYTIMSANLRADSSMISLGNLYMGGAISDPNYILPTEAPTAQGQVLKANVDLKTLSWQTDTAGSGDLKSDGSVPLSADWDNGGSHVITAGAFNASTFDTKTAVQTMFVGGVNAGTINIGSVNTPAVKVKSSLEVEQALAMGTSGSFKYILPQTKPTQQDMVLCANADLTNLTWKDMHDVVAGTGTGKHSRNSHVMQANHIVETDGDSELLTVAKGTAHNKNYGLTAGTTMQGDTLDDSATDTSHLWSASKIQSELDADVLPNLTGTQTIAPLTNYGRFATIYGRYLYTVEAAYTLYIYDLLDPLSPQLVNTGGLALGVGYFPKKMLVYGHDRLFISYNLNCPTFQVFDISDATNPTLVKTTAVNTTGHSCIVARAGVLYAAYNGTVESYSIDDPSYALISSVSISAVSVESVDISPDGKTLYVGSSSAGIILVDVSDPTSMSNLGVVETGYSHVRSSLLVHQNYLYVRSGSDQKVRQYDIHDSKTPTLKGTSAVISNATLPIISPCGRYVLFSHTYTENQPLADGRGIYFLDTHDMSTYGSIQVPDNDDVANAMVFQSVEVHGRYIYALKKGTSSNIVVIDIGKTFSNILSDTIQTSSLSVTHQADFSDVVNVRSTVSCNGLHTLGGASIDGKLRSDLIRTSDIRSEGSSDLYLGTAGSCFVRLYGANNDVRLYTSSGELAFQVGGNVVMTLEDSGTPCVCLLNTAVIKGNTLQSRSTYDLTLQNDDNDAKITIGGVNNNVEMYSLDGSIRTNINGTITSTQDANFLTINTGVKSNNVEQDFDKDCFACIFRGYIPSIQTQTVATGNGTKFDISGFSGGHDSCYNLITPHNMTTDITGANPSITMSVEGIYELTYEVGLEGVNTSDTMTFVLWEVGADVAITGSESYVKSSLAGSRTYHRCSCLYDASANDRACLYLKHDAGGNLDFKFTNFKLTARRLRENN